MVALLGADTAAALVSQAGGLAPLARMPACNILVRNLSKLSVRMTMCGVASEEQGSSEAHNGCEESLRLLGARCAEEGPRGFLLGSQYTTSRLSLLAPDSPRCPSRLQKERQFQGRANAFILSACKY